MTIEKKVKVWRNLLEPSLAATRHEVKDGGKEPHSASNYDTVIH
jgi:hypothetical protein